MYLNTAVPIPSDHPPHRDDGTTPPPPTLPGQPSLGDIESSTSQSDATNLLTKDSVSPPIGASEGASPPPPEVTSPIVDPQPSTIEDSDSKHTARDDDIIVLSEAPETEPVSKKKTFQITSSLVVRLPAPNKREVFTSDGKDPQTVLIAGVTIFRDEKYVPMLIVYRVATKPPKKTKLQKPSSLNLPPIAVDLEPEYAHFLDASMQGSSSCWEAPSKPDADDPDFPAVLVYQESLLLTEGVVPTCSRDVPEIKQIVSLDKSRLLAISCCSTVFSASASVLNDSGSVSGNSSSSVLLFSISCDGYVPPVSVRLIPTSESVVCIRALSDDTEKSRYKNSNEHVLLAILFKSGRVGVYDCDPPSPLLVATYQCPDSTGPDNGVVDCIYCPATNQLAVTTRDGRLWMLELDQESATEQESTTEQDVVAMEHIQQGAGRNRTFHFMCVKLRVEKYI